MFSSPWRAAKNHKIGVSRPVGRKNPPAFDRIYNFFLFTSTHLTFLKLYSSELSTIYARADVYLKLTHSQRKWSIKWRVVSSIFHRCRCLTSNHNTVSGGPVVWESSIGRFFSGPCSPARPIRNALYVTID